MAVRVGRLSPAKPYVGLELLNKKRQTVYLREVLDNTKFRDNPSPPTVVLGQRYRWRSGRGRSRQMPRLLVAGTTSSGKIQSVANAIILSMSMKAQPEDVRFIVGEMLELSVCRRHPIFDQKWSPDMKDAANALRWKRQRDGTTPNKLMSALGVRNTAGYNENCPGCAHGASDPGSLLEAG